MNKLLITSTIDVGNCFNVNRRDYDVRLSDYKKTITKYLEETDLDLVFIDNSMINVQDLFSEFLNKFKNRIEFISYKGNSGVDTLGKGHGERDSIIFALNNSLFLKNELFFYKVSGRYYSKDIYKIIKNTNINHYDCVNREKHKNNCTPTIFFGTKKKEFIDFFKNVNINENNILERNFSIYTETFLPNRVCWLPIMVYENSICSSGDIIKEY